MSVPPQGPQPPYGQPPHWPPPQPQPWQLQPYGQPPYGHYGPPPQYGQPAYGQPPQWQPPAPRRKTSFAVKALVIGFVIGGVGLLGYGCTRVMDAGEDRTAFSVSDYSHVCENDRIRNAADYSAPHHVAAFYYGLGIIDAGWQGMSISTTGDDSRDYTEIDAVACLERVKGSEVKSTTCHGKDKSVDYYSVEYEVELREAKTGKSVKTLGRVPGTADECPFLATYDGKTNKMYAKPDKDALAAMLKQLDG